MLINSIDVDVQKKGLYLGQRQVLVNFAMSNTDSPYNDIHAEGEELTAEELLQRISESAKKKCELICLGGGEPLLQVDYFKGVLQQMPLPLYLQTNGTLPQNIIEVLDYISMFGVELMPSYLNEFTQCLNVLTDSDYYVKLVVTKDVKPKEVEDYAKLIASYNEKTVFVLEPLFGVKTYLSLQAMALRHLKDVRVVPRMHI